MNYSEIKWLMGLANLSVGRIADETGYPDGDVTVCFQRKRTYQPLRDKIEPIFLNAFYKLLLDRHISQKDIEVLLLLLEFSADDVAAKVDCSAAIVEAWITGGPVPKRELKKIAGCVSRKLKESLFASSLKAMAV